MCGGIPPSPELRRVTHCMRTVQSAWFMLHTCFPFGSLEFWYVVGRGYREGNGTPLQYSCLENPMDGGAWKAAVHGVAKSRTRLSDFTFTFHFHALEKEMAAHSSVLTWRIPGTGQPGGLPSMGSHKSRTRLKQLSSSSSRQRVPRGLAPSKNPRH